MTAHETALAKALEQEHETVAQFLGGLATRDQLQRAWRLTAALEYLDVPDKDWVPEDAA